MKMFNKLKDNIFIVIPIVLLILVAIKIFIGFDSSLGHKYFVQSNSNATQVIIYTKDGCMYCDMTKEMLDKHGIGYEMIDLSYNPQLQQKLLSQTGQRTVPYIFINGEFIGGYTDLLRIKNW